MQYNIPEPRLQPPEGDAVNICPVCGEFFDFLVKDFEHRILGCDNCLRIMCAEDADDWWE